MKTKLTKCKTCGADIAKDAKTCPSCGAKNKVLHPIRGVIAGIIAIIFSIVLYQALTTPSSPSGKTEETPMPYYKISATDLWTAYDSNKVNADNLYKDKLIVVTGTISGITQDIATKDPCVLLDTGNPLNLYPIQCFFPDDKNGNEAIAALKDGDYVAIAGTCMGTPVVHVQLSNCYLTEE